MGYRVVEASNLRRRRGGLFAGGDEERAEGYRRLLRDADVDAIFFARGGYGSSRVLRLLDPQEARSNPKIHLGGSDVTALLAFLQRGARLVTFYGPMVAVEIGREDTLDWQSVLVGERPAPHAILPEDTLAPGAAEGVLLGGCLSLLASLAGTPEAIRGEGAVLFWEDVGEEIYRLDRLLTQLERSGTFEKLRAMVIGAVVPAGRNGSPGTVRDYLRERFAGSPFPVAMGLPAGHLPRPRTLPLGTPVRIDLQGAGEIRFLEAGVS